MRVVIGDAGCTQGWTSTNKYGGGPRRQYVRVREAKSVPRKASFHL